MGDMGDDFRTWRDDGKRRRARNRENSPRILREHGISFVTRNDGAHLIVMDKVDFWPGTGKWIVRETGRSGRGVYGLIRWIEKVGEQ